MATLTKSLDMLFIQENTYNCIPQYKKTNGTQVCNIIYLQHYNHEFHDNNCMSSI